MVYSLEKWSPRPDLNWWPPRYQRGALPTELHGQMVGMPGLEPGNPEGADLQSAAVAAVPHPHFRFQALDGRIARFLIRSSALKRKG